MACSGALRAPANSGVRHPVNTIIGDIAKIYETFLQKVVEIECQQAQIRHTTESEIKSLQALVKAMEQNGGRRDTITASTNHFFYSPLDGNPIFFGFTEQSVDERIKSAFLRKNKQYQWLLAEAYEQFEDLLEHVYAYIGFKDNNAWPLSDFGSIHLEELSLKPYIWFLQQASKKKDISSIMAFLREKFPKINEIERKNAADIDLRFDIAMIEALRHVIVHTGGTSTRKSDVIEGMFKRAGEYNNGKMCPAKLAKAKYFWGAGDLDGTICLTEIFAPRDGCVERYTDRNELLFRSLLAYAHLVCNTANSAYSGSPTALIPTQPVDET